VPAITSRPQSTEAAFVRAIGVRQLTAAIINTTVGAGIFVLPALVAQGMGAAAPLAFLVCAAIMALISVTLAVAGSRVSMTGGIYAYVETAFGPYVALLAGVLQWLTCTLGVASVSAALADQLGSLVPALRAQTARIAVLTMILTILAYLNARGVRLGTRLVEAVTVAKLAPLLIFVGVGAFFVDRSALIWPGTPDADSVARAVLVLIFAYAGVEVALAPSGEVYNPARTVPRAIFLALSLTTTFYVAIQLVAQGTLGALLPQQTAAPLAEAAARFLGGAGATLMLAGAVCSMFGYLCGDMLSTPRSIYALARDGFAPAILAHVHPEHRTPSVAIWTHAALVLALAGTQTFQVLAIVTNVTVLLLYVMACAAAVELTRRDVRMAGTPFAFPGAKVAPFAAAALMVWVLSTATMRELGVTGVVLALATLAYVVRNRASFTR
jgi:basic amino acid/polyamine antiporter, APA family